MDYNPFVAKLRVTDDEIEELEHRRADLVEKVAWATRFNPEDEADEIARLRSDLEERTAELRRLEAEISELDTTRRGLDSQTSALEGATRLGLRFFKWFTADYRRAKADVAEHEEELADLRERMEAADDEREQVAGEVAKLTGQIADNEQALARFRSFRPAEADEEIAEIDGKLSLLQKTRDHFEGRAADVERAVQAPLEELRKYESEIGDHASTLSKLRPELSRLKGQIAEAESFEEKLSRAASPSARFMLHQECQRRFGEGSPRAVLRAVRSQERSLKGSIGEHQRQIDRIRRDMAKTEERITKLAEVAARDIDALIIDGNNCCYQGNDFIGLAALIPMIENLAKRYALTVVFDAGIRGLLGVNDDDLRAALPAAEVHVVASRTKADETILDAADERTAWVVSNDRFGDYRDKASVKEGRVIRHEIVRGRILVHDLGVNEPLAVPSGT